MVASSERRLLNEISVHLAVSEAMVGTLAWDQILYVVLAGVVHPAGLDFDRAFLFLADEKGRTLRAADAVGPFDEAEARARDQALAGENVDLETLLRDFPESRKLAQRLAGFEVPVSASAPPIAEDEDNLPVHALVAHCAAKKKPFYSNSIQAFFQPPPASGAEVFRFRHVAAVPLLCKDSILGVLLADNHFSERALADSEIKGLAILGNLAAIAIENQRLKLRIEESALLDGLTGVFNRRYFEARLDQEIDRARKANRPLGLLVFHIPEFKAINSDHGYVCGDMVLKDLAEFLRRGVRAEDMIARHGQEDFLILLTGGATQPEALKIAHKLIDQAALEQLGGLPAGEVGLAGGVVWMPAEQLTGDALTSLLDEALEDAKQQGRGKVVSMSSSS